MNLIIICFALEGQIRRISDLRARPPQFLWRDYFLYFSISRFSYRKCNQNVEWVLSQSFPPQLSGMVNIALNLLVFVTAFTAQWASSRSSSYSRPWLEINMRRSRIQGGPSESCFLPWSSRFFGMLPSVAGSAG